MGNFRIEINAGGGHGCCREVRNGDRVEGCGKDSCPDCLARKFVAELKAKGFFGDWSNPSATFIHWPGTEGSVEENLLTGIRKGNFRE